MILMPAALAAAVFGQSPADLEAVSLLMAVIPGDLHAGGQVHLDRHAGHGACPVGVRRSIRKPSRGARRRSRRLLWIGAVAALAAAAYFGYPLVETVMTTVSTQGSGIKIAIGRSLGEARRRGSSVLKCESAGFHGIWPGCLPEL